MKEYFNILVENIKDEDLKRKLKENINNWREHSDYLWGSDPNKLMIDHGLRHAESLMDVLSDLVFCFFDKLHLNDAEIYCLIASVWLHDIGCAYEEEKDRLKLRIEHARYSLERIKHESDKLIGLDKEVKYIVAEICLHHSSRTPLTESQKVILMKKDRCLWDDPIREDYELIIKNESYKIRPRLLAALLSLADACDIGGRRIADIELKKDKIFKTLKVEERDEFIRHYNFHELVENIYFKEDEIIIEPRPASTKEDFEKINECIDTLLWRDIERVNEVLKGFSIQINKVYIGSNEVIAKLKQEKRARDLGMSEFFLSEKAKYMKYDKYDAAKFRYTLRPIIYPQYFVNRKYEINQIITLIRENKNKLIILCGPPGYGKSALIGEVIRELKIAKSLAIDDFIYICMDMYGQISFDTIFSQIEYSLGNPEDIIAKRENVYVTTEEKILILMSLMRRGRFIVIFDNFERCINQENNIVDRNIRLFIEKFIEFEHDDQLIIITRRAFFLSADRYLTDAAQISLDRGLSVNDSLNLLLKLAKGTALEYEEKLEVLRLVRKTMGIPKVIESIAALFKRRPLLRTKQVLESLNLLQEVVSSFVAQQFTELNPREQLVLQAISVFDEPVTEDAIGFILPQIPIQQIVESLIFNYLVFPIRQGEILTLTLQPLVQEYVYATIPDKGEYNKAYWHTVVANYFSHMKKNQQDWKSISDLYPNLSEIQHLIKAGYYDKACELINQIDFDYLYIWGYPELLLSLRLKVKEAIKDQKLAAINLRGIGNAYNALGDSEMAYKFYSEALALAQKINDKDNEGKCLSNMGGVLNTLGRISEAIECLNRAIEIAKKIGYKRGEAYRKNLLGEILFKTGNYEQATKYFNEARFLSSSVKDLRQYGVCLGNLGKVYLKAGFWEKSVEAHHEALALANTLNDRRYMGLNYFYIGEVYNTIGKSEKALEYFQKALEIFEEIRYLYGQMITCTGAGEALYNLDDIDKALENFIKALSFSEKLSEITFRSRIIINLGRIYFYIGELQKSILQFQKAFNIVKKEHNKHLECKTLDQLGYLYLIHGDIEESVDVLNTVVEEINILNDMELKCMSWGHLGAAYLYYGKLKNSEKLLQEAVFLSEKINNKPVQTDNWGFMGHYYLYSQIYDRARECYLKSLGIAKEINDRYSIAYSSFGLVNLLTQTGNLKSAEEYINPALKIVRDLKAKRLRAYGLLTYGDFLFYKGDYKQALENLEESLQLIQSTESFLLKSDCLTKLAKTYHKIGEFEKSKKYHVEAIRFAEKIMNKLDLRLALHDYALLLFEMDENAEAQQISKQYEILSNQLNLPMQRFSKA
ncbi:MAG: tetratricopeptide repeat protein [Bacteroidales bacterium]